MTWSFAQSGTKRVRLALLRLSKSAPRLLVDVAKEVNRNHAIAMRRRPIPYDTGRLDRSLATESSPDRLVTTTPTGVSIQSLVPYAKYQRHRIRPLNRQELQEIFITPIVLDVAELLAGRR